MDDAHSVLALHLMRGVSTRVDDLARAAAVDSDESLLALVRDYGLAISEADALSRVERVRRGLIQARARDAASVPMGLVLSSDVYQVEGTAVRHIRSTPAEGGPASVPEELSLFFWTDGDIDHDGELELRNALQKVLGSHLLIHDCAPPIRGSYSQLFKLKGIRRYLGSAVANLKSAFELTVTKQNVDVIVSLAKVLEKHENVVIVVEDFVALKYTENRKRYTFVGQVPKAVLDHLSLDPGLSKRPGAIHDLIVEESGKVAALSRPAKTLPIDRPPLSSAEGGTHPACD